MTQFALCGACWPVLCDELGAERIIVTRGTAYLMRCAACGEKPYGEVAAADRTKHDAWLAAVEKTSRITAAEAAARDARTVAHVARQSRSTALQRAEREDWAHDAGWALQPALTPAALDPAACAAAAAHASRLDEEEASEDSDQARFHGRA